MRHGKHDRKSNLQVIGLVATSALVWALVWTPAWAAAAGAKQSAPEGSLYIVDEPTVTEVTGDSAVITWKTNQSARGVVRYGRLARQDDHILKEEVADFAHRFELTGLEPATTYHYTIESDVGELRVAGARRFFRTAAPADKENPDLAALKISRLSGEMVLYRLEVGVSDDTGIDRVSFAMDGELLVTDYSGDDEAVFVMALATMGLTREELFDVPHEMTVTALDFAGRLREEDSFWDTPLEGTEITMTISPDGDYDLYVPGLSVPLGDVLDFEVYAEEKDWNCSWVMAGEGPHARIVRACDENRRAVERVEFYLDGTLEHTSWPTSNGDYSHEYEWSVSGLPLGTHEVRAVAVGRSGGMEERTVTVNIQTGEQRLDLERTAEWRDNFFSVELELTNVGTLDVELDTVLENMTGFLPWRLEGSYGVDSGTLTYDQATAQAVVQFDLSGPGRDYYLLRPESSVSIYYRAAPVLMPVATISHLFGDLPVEVEDHSGGYAAEIDRPTAVTEDGTSLEDAVDAAQAGADYLIVTAPEELYALHDAAAVGSLLESMAELAAYRLGVLGFLSSPVPDAEGVRTLIHAWGAPMRGSDGTEDHYHVNGYLVLVGEDEIIPSWDPDFSIVGFDNIQRSDLPYANTEGGWVDPELIVSRVIGNDPAALEASIRASLDVRAGTSGPGFDRENALAMAGDGSGWSAFHRNVEDVHARLDDELPTVSREKVRNLLDAGEDPMAWFGANVADRNVIYFRDHCWDRGWGETDVVVEGNFPLDFGAAFPFVFACCCQAGSYEEVGAGGIAETFTQNGAPVYIGATENSPRYHNNYYCFDFIDRWVGHDESFGQVFRQVKRDMDGYVDDYWAVEYQMYGDPKLGGTTVVAGFPAALTMAAPTEIPVTVPDYTVERFDGYDHVRVPGGRLFLESNRPAVPRYSVQQLLPTGYRVQDVKLVSRSKPKTVDGLQLFYGVQPHDVRRDVGKGEVEPGWWPEVPFRWEVEPSPDGSSTLRIHVYPFTYDPGTAEGRFYKQHRFEVRYTVSQVEVRLEQPGPLDLRKGEQTVAVLWIENAGKPLDAVVSAVVRPVRPDEEENGDAKGLPLRTLKDVQSLASYPLRWDAAGSPAGEYLVEVELREPDGDLLDSAVATFRLGSAAAKATVLTVTPTQFKPGQTLSVSFVVSNTGQVPVSGTATVQVLSRATERIVARLEPEVGQLAPGGSIKVAASWDSPDDACGTYEVTAYVLYGGQRTPLLQTTASTGEERCPPKVPRKGG